MTDVPSPVTGVVWKLQKQPGDTVAEGEVILILESMKMEIPIESPFAATVQQVWVAEGDSVAEGQPVARIG